MLSGIGLICADISSSPFFSEISGLVHHSQEISPKISSGSRFLHKPCFAYRSFHVMLLAIECSGKPGCGVRHLKGKKCLKGYVGGRWASYWTDAAKLLASLDLQTLM